MKPALIIGSTVADITINLPALPRTGQDVNILSQSMALGGCAFNVSEVLRHFQVPYILFSPVGTGIYGNYVRERLREKEIPVLIPKVREANGCCYCYVESSGERTFAALHGAEYRFQPHWFDLLDPAETGDVYVCGLELEEDTGPVILDYLKGRPACCLYFAPGPRLGQIGADRMQDMFDLSPVIHLNGQEVVECARLCEGGAWRAEGTDAVKRAARTVSRRTGNQVIVTLGPDGALLCDPAGTCTHIPGRRARQTDTNGAGDCHMGAVIACRMRGMSFEGSVRTANLVAAAAVEQEGAGIPDEVFAGLGLL